MGFLSALILASGEAKGQGLLFDDCGLAGKSFHSIHEHPVGEAGSTETLQLNFKDTSGEAPSYSFNYKFLDVVIQGWYKCEEKEGRISTTVPQFKEAFYNSTHSLLFWDGKWFVEDC